MLKRFPQLQSGFVAHGENLIEKITPPRDTPAKALLSHQPSHTQDDYFFSPAMDDLVNEAIQNPLSLRDFKFQQKLLEAAGRLFDKQSFVAFMRLQEKNPEMSSSHALFLEETIRVAVGLQQQRTVSLQSWASMLSTANASAIKPYRVSESLVSIFGTTTPFGMNSLEQFLTNWIRYAGYHDFIISMQVLFGRRSLHASFGQRR